MRVEAQARQPHAVILGMQYKPAEICPLAMMARSKRASTVQGWPDWWSDATLSALTRSDAVFWSDGAGLDSRLDRSMALPLTVATIGPPAEAGNDTDPFAEVPPSLN
jgi:hypothetical protein